MPKLRYLHEGPICILKSIWKSLKLLNRKLEECYKQKLGDYSRRQVLGSNKVVINSESQIIQHCYVMETVTNIPLESLSQEQDQILIFPFMFLMFSVLSLFFCGSSNSLCVSCCVTGWLCLSAPWIGHCSLL